MDASKVTIVILAHNHEEATRKCLKALEKSDAKGFTTVLVDNASTTSYAWLLDEYKRSPKHLMRNTENVAFASANNRAVLTHPSKYILLLNNDCYVTPTTISAMVNATKDKNVGIVGAKLLYPNLQRVQHCGMFFVQNRWPTHAYRFHAPTDPLTSIRGYWPAVTGACMLITKETWDAIGGLCELYKPGGCEDVDACLRSRELGRQVFYEPSAVAIHEESLTSYQSGPELAALRQKSDVVAMNLLQSRWWNKYSDLNNLTPRSLLGI